MLNDYSVFDLISVHSIRWLLHYFPVFYGFSVNHVHPTVYLDHLYTLATLVLFNFICFVFIISFCSLIYSLMTEFGVIECRTFLSFSVIFIYASLQFFSRRCVRPSVSLSVRHKYCFWETGFPGWICHWIKQLRDKFTSESLERIWCCELYHTWLFSA